MTKALPPLLLLAVVVSAQADTIWRCPGPEGPVFSNQPCEGAEAVTLQPLGEISSMDAPPPRRQARPQPTRPDSATTRRAEGPLSYGERTRWRQLRMELDGLERDLRRGHLHGRERAAAQTRITAARQELAPLDRRARAHPPSP